MEKVSSSDKTFFVLVLVMVFGKVVWTYAQLDHPLVQQTTSSWEILSLATVLGFFALKLAQRTGFPNIWVEKIPNSKRIAIPFLLGLGFAAIQIAIALAMQIPDIGVGFPLSIPVYLSVGILSEIIFRLIPTVFLLWLISILILRRRWEDQVFWTVAILPSLLEPVIQIVGIYQMGIATNISFLIILFVFVFVGNLIPVY